MNNSKLMCVAFAAGLLALSAASRAETLIEKIATVILADKFGIDTSQITQFRKQTNLPVYELAPIYEGAHYFKRSPSTVMQLRNEGLGWGQIAHRVGMHPGTFNKLRKQGAFDRDQFWQTSYRDRFGVTTERVEVLRRQGGTLEDVLGAIIIGKLTKQDPQTVYNQYQTQRSWTTVTKSNNVRFEEWRRVSTPVRARLVLPKYNPKVKGKSYQGTRYHWSGASKGKSKGQSGLSHGKGKGVLNGQGKGNGKSEDKGKGGKGRGNGNGNGKGKGKRG